MRAPLSSTTPTPKRNHKDTQFQEKEYLQVPIPVGKDSKWVLTRSLALILRFALRHLREGHKILLFDAQGTLSSSFLGIIGHLFDE